MRISDWSSDVCSSDLELPRRRQHRAIDLRSIGIFVEPDAILDAVIRRGAAGDQTPAGAAGGGQIATQLVVARFAVPGGCIERLAVGGRPHLLRIAARKSTRLNSSH